LDEEKINAVPSTSGMPSGYGLNNKMWKTFPCIPVMASPASYGEP
jgi:hypothetical protein